MKRCKSTLITGEYMRRSLTVTPENDKKILLTKGRFLTGDEPFDIDYTTMVNIFIELGHKLMSPAWNDSTNPNSNHGQKRNRRILQKTLLQRRTKRRSSRRPSRRNHIQKTRRTITNLARSNQTNKTHPHCHLNNSAA